MQGGTNAARMRYYLKRSGALLQEISNKRSLHVTQSNIQRPIISATKEENELSKLNKDFRQRVATDGLRTFIEKITAKPKEARMWLKYFKSKAFWDEGQAFCVLHVTEDVCYNVKIFETFIWSAAFLMQNKMKPVLVFGTKRKKVESIQDVEEPVGSDKVDMNWNKLEILGSRMQKLLLQYGVESSVYTGDKQVLRYNDEGKLNIDVEEMKCSLLADHVPIVTNFLFTDEKVRLFDPVTIAEMITQETKPMKLMYLSCEKGIRDNEGKVISDIILPLGNSSLDSHNWSEGNAKKKVERIGHLLEKLPLESSVILTSADTVIQELFTHHGSGTLIKRSEPVNRVTSLNDVNEEELGRLLSDSFGKPLPEDYFNRIRDMVDSIYISESYSAAVIILRLPNIKVPYMDKFAVRTMSQGGGLTTQIWTEIVKDYHQLFWRSNPNNSGANGWYNSVCQGAWKAESWIVFWYGLQTCREVFPLIDAAVTLKPTFSVVSSNESDSFSESDVTMNSDDEQDQNDSSILLGTGSQERNGTMESIPVAHDVSTSKVPR